MANPPVTLPGTYDMIVEYQNASTPTVTWRNTYTFQSSVLPTLTTPIVAAIGSFAFNLVHSDVNYIGWKVYNWARGRQPYPLGSPVLVDSFSSPGNAGTEFPSLHVPYTPAGGEVALRVDHEPATAGRPGRNFLRGLLGSGDLSAISGGRWNLVTPLANINANYQAVLNATGLSSFFGPGSGNAALVIVRYSPKTGIIHGVSLVNGFTPLGVTTVKLSRKGRK